MRLIRTWTHRVIVIMTLASGSTGLVFADGTISTSNRSVGNLAGSLGGQMQALLGQEHAAVGAVEAGHLQQLTAPAVSKVAPVPALPPVVVAAKQTGGQTGAAMAKAQPVVVAETKVQPRQPTAAAPDPAAPIVLASARPVEAKPADFWHLLTSPQQPGTETAAQAKTAAQARPVQPGLQYSASWLATQPVAHGDANWECLAKALYFEARGETVKGQFAVGEVVLNRVDSGLYPRSICGVVNQGSRYACQFSFICDGHADRIHEPAIYQQVGKIAALLIAGAPRSLTDGATHFRTGAVMPTWARRFPQTAKIGAHYFHRQPIRLASG